MSSWKLLVPVAVLILTGCASKDGASTGDGAPDEYLGGADDSVSTYGSGMDGVGSGSALDDARAATVQNERVIYFDFDSADVAPASVEVLKQHASYLADNSGARVRLEGHTDERGSREYNIGLGERRSVSVESILLAYGAMREQLLTVSFGEERPAALGSDESAWSQNRRVELVYE